MRNIGTINLKFSMVNIPLSVNSFLDYSGISFKQLCPYCNKPIRYKRWCDNCQKEIPYSELKSGFQVSKDEIIPIDKEVLNSLEIETRIITVMKRDSEFEFLTEKCYLLTPAKKIPKPYFLLRNLLIEEGLSLLIEFSLRKKIHLGIIKPITLGNHTYLLLKQILYADKIKSIEPLKEENISEEEMELGKELLNIIKEKTKGITYKEIKDKRVELLEKILKGEIKPKEIKVETKESDLLSQLKQTVEVVKRKKKKV